MAASTNIVGVGSIWRAGQPVHGISDCLTGGDCSGLLWEHGFAFTVMTVILGGGCAFMSGRALALSWRPVGQLIFYMALLGLAVRFLHWGLFRGTLISPHYYVIDSIVVILIAVASYGYARASMMSQQYFWLYKRTGPFTWSRIGGEVAANSASTPQAGA